jgi:hypothetical protein
LCDFWNILVAFQTISGNPSEASVTWKLFDESSTKKGRLEMTYYTHAADSLPRMQTKSDSKKKENKINWLFRLPQKK